MSISVQPSDTSDHPVLILDDESAVLHSLRETLERRGYHVVTCLSPLKALELVRDRPFSVILTDMRMPEMTGLDFLEHCEVLQPDATRVLITAVLSLSSVLDAINSGRIYRFIPKPWLHEELLGAIENSVQRFMLTVNNHRLAGEVGTLRERLAKRDKELAEERHALQSARKALLAAQAGHGRQTHRSLELCWRILNTYDPFLGGRTRALVDLAHGFAGVNACSEADQRVLETAAWLCDLGLLGVSREALHHSRSRPGALSESDRSLIRNHPIYSQTLAALLDDDPALGATIRAHHEHIDGSGYPDGLVGEAIPWTARCLAVAVAYAESEKSHSETHHDLLQASGKLFDPEAVRLFIASTRQSPANRPVREVQAEELEPGMILSHGLYSPAGLLLVSEGHALTEATIEKIRIHHFVHPFAAPVGQRLSVYT